jgi:hypothetical protein
MSYRDESENYMYVHSISHLEGEVKGGFPLFNWIMRREKSTRPHWASWRLLDIDLLDELEVVVMNHSIKSGTSSVQLLTESGECLWETKVDLNPRATSRVKVPENFVSKLKKNMPAKHIRIGVNPLYSANGKPYVLLKYGQGPLSLHHG